MGASCRLPRRETVENLFLCFSIKQRNVTSLVTPNMVYFLYKSIIIVSISIEHGKGRKAAPDSVGT